MMAAWREFIHTNAARIPLTRLMMRQND